MSRKRTKTVHQQIIGIKTRTSLPAFINWLHRRLFLLKSKFCFQVPREKGYILLGDFTPTVTGVMFSAALNGKERLGTVDMTATSENAKGGVINIHYRYPKRLSQLVNSLILDTGFHFNSLESIPPDAMKNIQDPDPLPEEAIPVMELEFFLENVTIDQFSDWVASEYQDILAKLFPAMGWLLEIQPPEIFDISNNHRTIAMEGRLYKNGTRGLALFAPNPLTNQRCISFEVKQLSTTRLHIFCRANKFSIEHFREMLTKIEKNWPETKESVRRFLAAHRGETVVPVFVKMGPAINTLTGEIEPEPEKYYRAEYRFKGSPLQFSVFITNYGNILSDKYKSEVVVLLEPASIGEKHIAQAKAMFFPMVHLDFEQQKGVFGEIIAQALPDQTSMIMVESQRHCWDKIQGTWDIIFSEMERQGWIDGGKAELNRGKTVSSSDVFISYSHKDKEYAHILAKEFEHNTIITWIDDRIDYGTTWPRVVQDNLNACPIFVVIMSQNAYQSTWVQNEVMYAQMKRKRIFPLLLEGETWLSLASTQHIDVKDKKMPSQRFFDTIKKALKESTDGTTGGEDVGVA